MTYKIINWGTIAITIFTVGITLTISSTYGFLSPDSWAYIQLTESIIRDGMCLREGRYFATFPCGYPLAISLVSITSGIGNLILASKLANAAILLSIFLVVITISKNWIVAFISVVNPVSLYIAHYTWSENLFTFSVISCACAIHCIHSKGLDARTGTFLLAALIAGCYSRYIFWPFAVIIFALSFIVYGRKTAIRVFPFFAFSGLLAITYFAFNGYLTGSGTGSQRIPAPESTVFLFIYFSRALIFGFGILLFGISPLVTLYRNSVGQTLRNLTHSLTVQKSALWYLFVLLGISYLALIFTLRAAVQFDLFDTRLVGIGILLIVLGPIGIATDDISVRPAHLTVFLFVSVISLSLVNPGLYLSLFNPFKSVRAETYAESMRHYGAVYDEPTLVVHIGTPSVNPYTAANLSAYYGDKVNLFVPQVAPYAKPEGLQEFLMRIRSVGAEHCFYDFSNFANVEEFYRAIDTKYAFDIEVEFPSDSWLPHLRLKRSYAYSDELRAYFRSIFSPGQRINCDYIQQ